MEDKKENETMAEKDMPAKETKSMETPTKSGINPIIVVVISLVLIAIVGIIGYFVFVQDSDTSYDLVEDYNLYEGEDYRVQYPSDWDVEDGSIPMFYNQKYLDAGEFNPNLNVVILSEDVGTIKQSDCDELADAAEVQYSAYLDSPEVLSSDIVDTKYHSDTCKVTVVGDISALGEVYGVKLSQIVVSENGKLYVVSYGYEEETETELETLEMMADTFKAGSY